MTLTIGLTTGCQEEYTNYSIESTVLQHYLQSYLSEARERGVVLEPQTTGLILSFGDCEGTAAGTTFYENPVRIVIDKPYWDNCAKYADGDYLHEEVVFHELTHALLYRGHDNATLPDGEWKSIMRGGTLPEGRNNNVSFRGMRREYYIDELFHASVPAPGWSLPTPKVPTPAEGLQSLVADDFQSGTYNTSHYYMRPTYPQSRAVLSGQELVYENAESNMNYYFHLIGTGATTEQDFYLTTTVRLTNADADHGTLGLTFGDVDNNALVSIRMSEDRQFHIYDNRERFASVYLPCASSPFSGENIELGIRRTGNRLDYYVNSHCVYTDSLTLPIGTQGNFFALILPSKADTHIRNVTLLTEGKGTLRSGQAEQTPHLRPVLHHALRRPGTD